jgi:hypothetical protein
VAERGTPIFAVREPFGIAKNVVNAPRCFRLNPSGRRRYLYRTPLPFYGRAVNACSDGAHRT